MQYHTQVVRRHTHTHLTGTGISQVCWQKAGRAGPGAITGRNRASGMLDLDRHRVGLLVRDSGNRDVICWLAKTLPIQREPCSCAVVPAFPKGKLHAPDRCPTLSPCLSVCLRLFLSLPLLLLFSSTSLFHRLSSLSINSLPSTIAVHPSVQSISKWLPMQSSLSSSSPRASSSSASLMVGLIILITINLGVLTHAQTTEPTPQSTRS